MKPQHGDFWDQVLAFICEAHDECSRMVTSGSLDEFEKAWVDPTIKLSQCSWFADARPVARKIAKASVTSEIKRMIEYYRFAETLLGGS